MPVFKEPITEYQQNRGYSSVSPIFMERTIRDFVRANTPGVQYAEDGFPVLSPEESAGLSPSDIAVRRQRYRPEEAQTILDHRQEILELAVKDRLVMAAKPDAQRLDEYIRLQKPDYTPLTDSERAAREAFSEEMRIKYATFAAKRDMTIDLLITPGTPVTRTEECLLKVDVSDEGIAWNRELIRDLGSKDPAVQKKAYGRALMRIADETDMTRLDLTNDSNIKDNFESYYSLISSGAEIQALVENYLNLGGDTDPEVEKRLGKLYAMHDAAGLLRARVDTLASPVHSMVRTEQLYKDPKYLGFPPKDAGDKTVEMDNFLYPRQMPDDYFITNFMQIQATKVLSQGAPYMNYDMTPEQRLKASVEDNKAVIEADRQKAERRAEEARRKAEQERLKKEAHEAEIKKYVNMERIPQGLSPEMLEKRYNYEIQLRKNITALQKAIKENNEKQIPRLQAEEDRIVSKYITDVTEADANFTGEERDKELRKLNAQKDEDLRDLAHRRSEDIIRELNLTEDQIQACLTPERIALLDRMNAVKESQEDRLRTFKTINNVPGSFGRVLFASLKDSKQPGADAHNRHLEELMHNTDYQSRLERRQMIIDDVNGINDLDSEKMSWDVPFDELADYAIEHMDACEIGYEFQNTYLSMQKTLGFTEQDELKEYMKNVVDKGVVLGGTGRTVKELLADDKYMKFPFEHLDVNQLGILIGEVAAHPHEYGIDDPQQLSTLPIFTTYAGSKQNRKTAMTFKEPDKKVNLDLTSFKDCIPDSAQYVQRIDALEARFDDTDHWYNRRSSSDEYREMRGAMKNLRSEVEKLPTEAGNPEALRLAEKRLLDCIESYVEHVGDKPKNNNQRLRAETAKEMATVVQNAPAKSLNEIIRSNALAKPEERANYEKLTTPVQKPKQESRQTKEDTHQRIEEITRRLEQAGAAKTGEAEKKLYDMLATARKDLSNELKKASPNPEVVKPMVAAIVTCQMYRRELEGIGGAKPNPDMTVVYDNKEVRFTDMNPAAAKAKLGTETLNLMNSTAFKEAVPKLTEEKLHQFLLSEEPAKTEVMRDICGNMDNSREGPEGVGHGSAVKNETRQIDAPKKEGKLLGK